MSFAKGVADWIALLTQDDFNFIEGICKQRNCMFSQVVAGQRLNTSYLTDCSPDVLKSARRQIRNNNTLIATIDCVLFLKERSYV